MNNPFDLENYKPLISMRDQEKARRNAYQATQYINKQRKQGIEPSKPYAERTAAHLSAVPKEMVVDMPAMVHYRKRRNYL